MIRVSAFRMMGCSSGSPLGSAARQCQAETDWKIVELDHVPTFQSGGNICGEHRASRGTTSVRARVLIVGTKTLVAEAPQCAFAGLFASACCIAFFLRRLRINGRRLRRSTRLSIFFQKPQK